MNFFQKQIKPQRSHTFHRFKEFLQITQGLVLKIFKRWGRRPENLIIFNPLLPHRDGMSKTGSAETESASTPSSHGCA